MKKTLLVIVIMALIIGLCAAAVSAKSDDGQGMGQELSLQQGGILVFSDVEGHWAAWAINKAQARGIFSGYGDGTFGPENYLTNAQVLVLLDRLTDDDDDDKDDDADDEDDDADDDEDDDADDDDADDADDDENDDADDDEDDDADDDENDDADDDENDDADDDENDDADDDENDDADDDENDDADDDENDDADDEDDNLKNVPAWANSAVKKAVTKGYINRFHSETQCQRAFAFAVIAQELKDADKLDPLPPGYENPFKDVFNAEDLLAGLEDDLPLSADQIYEYMMLLHYNNIIKGSDGNLNANSTIKRAEMAVLMNNVADLLDDLDD